MDSTTWLIIALVVLLVVVAGTGLWAGTTRKRSARPPVEVAPSAPPSAPPQEEAEEAPGTPAPAAGPEQPAAAGGRMQRLRARLAANGSPFGAAVLKLLSRDGLSEADWDEIEETLLLADLGAQASSDLLERLRTRVRVAGATSPEQVRALLREELLALVDPTMDRSLDLAPRAGADGSPAPAVVVMVGVNGTGKTTTVGKLARLFVAEGHSVLLGAADTFRAAAADQLVTWGQRVGVPTVRSDRDGADPAAVAFDAVSRGRTEGVDVVLVDTAGRLQNRTGLMDELGKIRRVIAKVVEPAEVLLVIDATTGQNGLSQARVFAQVVPVTGVVLTKLDGTARGGIVVAIQRELGVPVKLVGLGEGPDDLAPFDPESFVDGVMGL